MSGQPRIGRRTFVGGLAAAAATGLLAACAPPAPPAAAPAPAQPGGAAAKPAEAPKIFTMVDKTWADLGMSDATLRFNQDFPELGNVTLEETAEGWDTKVLQQIRDKNLRWSAHGYAPFADTLRFVRAGLAAPLDDYLKASKFPWATKQKEVYFNPRIWDALAVDGKQYYIPMKANVHLVGYRSDYLQAAGYNAFPKTWDEVDQMLGKLKPVLEKEQAVGLGVSRDLFRTLGTAFTTFVDKPFDDDGVLKFESPEWFQLIELVKKWKDQGMARIDNQTDHTDIWQKGKFAFSLGSHSLVRLGRQIWGSSKVAGAPPPQANASAPPRTWVHIDSGFVFPNAPAPQLATDWLLAVLGPEGAPAERWWKGVVTFSGQPVHQTMLDKVLKGNNDLKEVYEVMQLVPNSFINTTTVAGAYAIVQAKIWPHLDRYFSGELSAKQAMANTRQEVNDELAKQKKA